MAQPLDKERYAILGLPATVSGQWILYQNPPGTYLFTLQEATTQLGTARQAVDALKKLLIVNVETGHTIPLEIS